MPQVPESVGNLLDSDEVEISVTMNRRSGARKARSVSLLARSADRRELGKVCAQISGNILRPGLDRMNPLKHGNRRDKYTLRDFDESKCPCWKQRFEQWKENILL